MKIWTVNIACRILRRYGAREFYNHGGQQIIYCGLVAFRIINEYTFESWNHRETLSGTIHHFDSPKEMGNALTLLGLEALGVI